MALGCPWSILVHLLSPALGVELGRALLSHPRGVADCHTVCLDSMNLCPVVRSIGKPPLRQALARGDLFG